MVRVLYFVDRLLHGGIQTFILENIRHMDNNKVQVDLLLLDDGKNYDLETVFEELGCRVFKLKGIWIKKPVDYLKYKKALKTFFSKHNDYDIIHLHSSSKNYMVLKYAKKNGIKTRIAHSHNIGFQSKSKFQILIGNLMKPFLKRYATDFFACSSMAGKWLFGNKEFIVVKNAVDISKFLYNYNTACDCRKELGLEEDSVVIGHIGRFTHQKNHEFLIEVFDSLYKKNNKYRLLLVGQGELEKRIKRKVEELKLLDAVIFAGFQSDVSKYMQAMDLFVFPSEFEGLGLVLIEAQASGLPCFASEKVIPAEAKVSKLLSFISLEKSPEEWASIIEKYSLGNRKSPSDEIIKNGYDIRCTASYLQDYYIRKSGLGVKKK